MTTHHHHETVGYDGRADSAGPAMMIIAAFAILLVLLVLFATVWTPWASTRGGTGGGTDTDQPVQEEVVPEAPSGPQIVP